MAVTVGTNAYISLVDFKAWALERNKDISAYTDTQINGAIVESSVDFIDVQYTFIGEKDDPNQAMQLPTDRVSIADIINGAALATLLTLQGRLFVNPLDINMAGIVESESSGVGSLNESVTYRGGSILYYLSASRIDDLLQRFTIGNGLGVLNRF